MSKMRLKAFEDYTVIGTVLEPSEISKSLIKFHIISPTRLARSSVTESCSIILIMFKVKYSILRSIWSSHEHVEKILSYHSFP